jgi:hypothetical protein
VRLINRDIVKETSDDPPFYTFTADLYRQLIAKYKSLHRVVPELIKEEDSTSPVLEAG